MPSTTQGSNWIRRKRRHAIYARDGWRCVWCTREVRAGDRRGKAQPGFRLATLDHYAYGCNRSDNLLTSCKECNTLRGEMTAERFAMTLRCPCSAMMRVVTAIGRQRWTDKSPDGFVVTGMGFVWDVSRSGELRVRQVLHQ